MYAAFIDLEKACGLCLKTDKADQRLLKCLDHVRRVEEQRLIQRKHRSKVEGGRKEDQERYGEMGLRKH